MFSRYLIFPEKRANKEIIRRERERMLVTFFGDRNRKMSVAIIRFASARENARVIGGTSRISINDVMSPPILAPRDSNIYTWLIPFGYSVYLVRILQPREKKKPVTIQKGARAKKEKSKVGIGPTISPGIR